MTNPNDQREREAGKLFVPCENCTDHYLDLAGQNIRLRAQIEIYRKAISYAVKHLRNDFALGEEKQALDGLKEALNDQGT